MAAQAIAAFAGVSNVLKPGKRESLQDLFPDLPSKFRKEKERNFQCLYSWGRRVGGEWIKLSTYQKLYIFNDGTVPILFLRRVLDKYWLEVEGKVDEVKSLKSLFQFEVSGVIGQPSQTRNPKKESVVVTKVRGPTPSSWDQPSKAELSEIKELLDLEGVRGGVQKPDSEEVKPATPGLSGSHQLAPPLAHDLKLRIGKKRSQTTSQDHEGMVEKKDQRRS